MIRFNASKRMLRRRVPVTNSSRWLGTCSVSSLAPKALHAHSNAHGFGLRARAYSQPSPAERAQTSAAEDIANHVDPFKEAREIAHKYAEDNGYDLSSLWEENVAWGYLDSFRHLNNVNYVRFFETSRMHMMYVIALETYGPKGAKAILEGLGISIILKSIDVKFKRPVTYPDNLVMMQRPHSTSPSRFTLSSVAYSLAQRAPVATAEAVCVWYDYDVWKKCDIDESAGLGLAIAKRSYEK